MQYVLERDPHVFFCCPSFIVIILPPEHFQTKHITDTFYSLNVLSNTNMKNAQVKKCTYRIHRKTADTIYYLSNLTCLSFRYEILTPNAIPKGFMDGKQACVLMVSKQFICFFIYCFNARN